MTALVLGVGGNVSQGILKALAASSLEFRVVAGCVSPLSLGLYAADRAYVSPMAADPGFLAWVEETCEREGVAVVLSGTEPVLEALAPHAAALRAKTGAVCVTSPPEVLAVGRDKLLTADWLERQGLPFPRTADAADWTAVRRLVEAVGLPVVAKPRHGKGAAGVVVVQTPGELDLIAGREELVVQELLGDDRDEYTVGCVCEADGRLAGVLAMRRELSAGTTYRAEAGEFPEVREAAARIAEALRPVGPLNVQLRLHRGRPVAFELNVRFSGTTPIRARLGFNEVEATVRHLVLGEALELPVVTKGRVLRYWNELYVPEEAHDLLERDGRLDDPAQHGPVVEDWGMLE
ncbi:MAG: ATP-grasp domain-containing protein [Solirubrobacterales bacterium]